MNKVTHGDIIEFNGMKCYVQITGYESSYKTVDGKPVNCATGTEGYLIDLDTGYQFRAKWYNPKIIMKADEARCFERAIWALRENYIDFMFLA